MTSTETRAAPRLRGRGLEEGVQAPPMTRDLERGSLQAVRSHPTGPSTRAAEHRKHSSAP